MFCFFSSKWKQVPVDLEAKFKSAFYLMLHHLASHRANPATARAPFLPQPQCPGRFKCFRVMQLNLYFYWLISTGSSGWLTLVVKALVMHNSLSPRCLYLAFYFCSLKYTNSPGWCGSVDWVLTCEQKGHRFDSQSGHKTGLQTRAPAGCVLTTDNRPMNLSHIDLSPPLFLPPFPSL